MTLLGHVKNGKIELDEPVALPEGAKVQIEVALPKEPSEEIPTLYESLEPFIGKAEGLPPDMSVNLDHYLYGLPKRE